MVLAQIRKQISSTELTSYEKSLENKRLEFSCTNTWSLSKILSKFMETSFRTKKKAQSLV